MKDQIALITGASSGIGRATALALARRGVRLSLLARRAHELEALAQEIQSLGGQALALPTDVTERESVRQAVSRTLAHYGAIDIVVVNAGAYLRCPIPHLTIEILQQSMAVNFYGGVHVVLEVLPHMLARRRGHIVLVTSMAAKKGIPPDGPYVAAKWALTGLGDVMRQELRAYGIEVTTVLPGRVDTPMLAGLDFPRISAKIPPELVAEAIVRALRRHYAEVIIPRRARLLAFVQCWAPRLADWLVRTLHLEGWSR